VPAGDVVAVDSGALGACARYGDGHVDCYGSWRDGSIVSGRRFDAWSVGWTTACGLRGTSLSCFDLSRGTQLAVPSGSWVDVDVAFPGLVTPAREASACARSSAGAITCFDQTGAALPSPGVGPFVASSSSGSHACGVRADGSLACIRLASATVPFPAETERVSEVVAGSFATWWIRSDGTIGCVADLDAASACSLLPTDGPYTHLTGGSAHACAQRADGRWRCWGSDAYGAGRVPSDGVRWTRIDTYDAGAICGLRTDGRLACIANPRGYPLPSGSFVDLRTGGDLVCGLSADGTATCTGGSTLMPAGPSGPWTDLELASAHACMLDDLGALACRGDPTRGATLAGRFVDVAVTKTGGCVLDEAGNPTCWDKSGSPPPPASGPFVALESDDHHVCGQRPDGTWSCWGFLFFGLPSTTTPYVALGMTGYGSCGLTDAGTIECDFGYAMWNADGPTTGRYLDVDGGNLHHACALRDDGVPICWGDLERPALP
jgi:hypothetical protein